jgi:hypothetical protein
MLGVHRFGNAFVKTSSSRNAVRVKPGGGTAPRSSEDEGGFQRRPEGWATLSIVQIA